MADSTPCPLSLLASEVGECAGDERSVVPAVCKEWC